MNPLGRYGGHKPKQKVEFSSRKVIKQPADFILSGSGFRRVGPATKKYMDSIFVLILGVKRRSELDDRRCLGFPAGVSSECKYADYDDESSRYVKSADLENYTISYGQPM